MKPIFVKVLSNLLVFHDIIFWQIFEFEVNFNGVLLRLLYTCFKYLIFQNLERFMIRVTKWTISRGVYKEALET